MPDSIGARVARLDERLNSIDRTLDRISAAISEQNNVSSAYRSAMRDELGKIVMRTTHLESDAATIKQRMEAMQEVTADVERLRQRAIGAGTLGRWMLAMGSALLGAAGGAAAVYTWITGRPPP